MLQAFFLLVLVAFTGGQKTSSGCDCKASSEVIWRAGGRQAGGFSHVGCGTGPYEDKSPAKGKPWCDTVQTACNNGAGWDYCQGAQRVAVNDPQFTAALPAPTPGTSSAPIKTVSGCTCHAKSEVLLMRDGVQVGGGFSHTGCGTGPWEAYSPGKGNPWCDTVESLCSQGWDLCVPPAPTPAPFWISQPPTPQNLFGSTQQMWGSFRQPSFAAPTPSPFSSSYSYSPPWTTQPQAPVQSQPSSPQSYNSGGQGKRRGRGGGRARSRGSDDYDYDSGSSSSSSGMSSMLPLLLASSSSGSSSSGSSSLLPFLLTSSMSSKGGSSNSMLPFLFMSSFRSAGPDDDSDEPGYVRAVEAVPAEPAPSEDGSSEAAAAASPTAQRR